jgi:hypothetical protein
MSFLDSLENNLKALESREEKDPEKIKRDRESRDAAIAASLALAPQAEALKSGPFTEALLIACRNIGHGMRLMVRFTWIGSDLRLETKDKKLELRPSPAGVMAHYFVANEETRQERVDLTGDAEALARRWLEEKTPGMEPVPELSEADFD